MYRCTELRRNSACRQQAKWMHNGDALLSYYVWVVNVGPRSLQLLFATAGLWLLRPDCMALYHLVAPKCCQAGWPHIQRMVAVVRERWLLQR